MESLEEVIIDNTELNISMTGLEKKAEHPGQSNFTFYTRNYLSVLTKQFNLVDKMQLSVNTYLAFITTNALQSGPDRNVPPVMRDLTETCHYADIRWYEEQCDGEQYIVTLLQLY